MNGCSREIIWFFLITVFAIVVGFPLSDSRRLTAAATGVGAIAGTMRPERIVIERRDRPRVVLVREGAWRLMEPFSSVVDERAVMMLADRLLLAESDDVMTTSEMKDRGKRELSDFALDDPALKVEFSGGGKSVVFAFGDSLPSSNGVYAVVSGFNGVTVLPASVRDAALISVDELRDRAVFPLTPESVVSFSVKRPDSVAVAFHRDGEGWKSDGTAASTAKVKEFLAMISGARAESFVWPTGAAGEASTASSSLLSGYGLDPENAVTITLRCSDGSDRRIIFGSTAGEGLVYSLVQNGSSVVTLDAAIRNAATIGAEKFTDSRLFQVEESAVRAFSLVDGDVTCALSRDAAGGWRLDAPVSAPADSDVVTALLGRMLSLASSDLDEKGVRVSLSTNSAPIAVAASRLYGDIRIEDLRSREVIKVDSTSVRRIVSTPGGGRNGAASVVYSRDRGQWNIENGDDDVTVDEKGIAAVLTALESIRAIRVVALRTGSSELSGYGLSEPFHTIAVDRDREGDVRRNVLIGSAADGGRYVTIGSAEAIFLVSDEVVSGLMSPIIRKRK